MWRYMTRSTKKIEFNEEVEHIEGGLVKIKKLKNAGESPGKEVFEAIVC